MTPHARNRLCARRSATGQIVRQKARWHASERQLMCQVPSPLSAYGVPPSSLPRLTRRHPHLPLPGSGQRSPDGNAPVVPFRGWVRLSTGIVGCAGGYDRSLARIPLEVRALGSGDRLRARGGRGVTLLSAGWPQAGPSRHGRLGGGGAGRGLPTQAYYPPAPGFPQGGVPPRLHRDRSNHLPAAFQGP